MKSINKGYLGGLVLGALALGLSSVAHGQDKVSLRLDWVYGAEHAPIFLAMEKGYFADAGIDLELLPGEGSSVTVKLVGNRDADFGYASADQVLLGAQRNLPLVATGVVLQKNATALIFKAAQNISDIKTDLAGKTIGVQLKSSTSLQWQQIKQDMGLDASTFTEVPADGAVVALISADRIDAGVGFFFNDGLKLRASGEDVDWILFEDLGLKMYSTSLFTNAELIAENPDLVRRFTQAVMQGWTYSVAHPDEALAAFIAANPETDKVYAELKLPEVLAMTQSDNVTANGLGNSTQAEWEGLQDKLLAMGVVTEAIDVSTVFTNDFLK